MSDFTANVILQSNTPKQWAVACEAKLDTGAARTSIDVYLSQFLRLDTVGETTVSNAMGSQVRELVILRIIWEGHLYEVEASITDRSNLSKPVIIGRDILGRSSYEK